MSSKQLVNWKVLILWTAAAALMSWALHTAAGLNAQWTVIVVIGALILTSVIAEIEARMTGKPSTKKNKLRR